jgi:predicted PurR-regulated permease PerM
MLKKERILDLKKYFVFLLILLLVFISYSIIKPFMIALISAFILAFFLRPFYKTLNKKLSSSLSAIISILAMILIIAIPGTLILNRLRLNIQQQITSENIAKISELSIPLVEKFAGNAEKIIEILASLSISLINSTINYVPSLILNLIIILVGIYYILPNWEKIVNYLEKIFPIQNQKEISREISKTTKGIIYGLLLLAVLHF